MEEAAAAAAVAVVVAAMIHRTAAPEATVAARVVQAAAVAIGANAPCRLADQSNELPISAAVAVGARAVEAVTLAWLEVEVVRSAECKWDTACIA